MPIGRIFPRAFPALVPALLIVGSALLPGATRAVAECLVTSASLFSTPAVSGSADAVINLQNFSNVAVGTQNVGGNPNWFIKSFTSAFGDTLNSSTTWNGASNGTDYAYGVCQYSTTNEIVVVGTEAAPVGGQNWRVTRYGLSGWNVLGTTTYNGPMNSNDTAYGVAYSNFGGIYVVGHESVTAAGQDWRIIRYDSDLTTILGTTSYNGPASNDDQALAIAVDWSGSVWVVGKERGVVGLNNWSVRKYNRLLTTLVASTTFDGPVGLNDYATSIVIDASGNAIVGGVVETTSLNDDWLIRKYNPTLTAVLASTTYGGATTTDDLFGGLTLDTSGNVVATGGVNVAGQNSNVAVRRYDPTLTIGLGSTIYDRAAGTDYGHAVDVDGAGIIIVGATMGSDAVIHAQTLDGPCLSAAVAATPAGQYVGGWTTVRLTVTNTGGADANVVSATLWFSTGGGFVQQIGPVVPAGAQLIPNTGTMTWTWTLSVSGGTGTVSLTGSVTGSDDNTSFAVRAAAYSSFQALKPAALTATVMLGLPSATPSVGQWFTLRLTVTNPGDATATGVTPFRQVNLGSALVVQQSGPVPAGPLSILAGGTTTFIWTYSVSGAGAIQFTATAVGLDAGLNRIILGSGTRSLTTYPPVVLNSALSVFPNSPNAGAHDGQPLWVRLTVTNNGGVTANSVSATLHLVSTGGLGVPISSPGGSLALAPGASTTFEWRWLITGPGTQTFSVTANGIDSSDGQPVSATALGSMATANRAALTIQAQAVPSPAGVGHPFVIRYTVSNTGGVEAKDVGIGPSTFHQFPANDFLGLTPSSAQNILPGTSTRFEYAVRFTAAGPISLTVSVSGKSIVTDVPTANAGTFVSASVVQASMLSAVMTIEPAPVLLVPQFKVMLAVSNAGAAGVSGLTPAITLTSGAGLVTNLEAPAAVPLIPAGGAASFTWTYKPIGGGAFGATATASGVDAATGGTVSVSDSEITSILRTIDTNLPDPGKIQVRNNVLKIADGGTVRIVARGEAGGSVEVFLYGRGGHPLGRIGTGPVILDADGLAVIEWDGMLDGKPLTTGTYWIIVTGAAKDRKQVVIVNDGKP